MTPWAKRVICWKCADTLYLSVPFTWLLPEAEGLADQYRLHAGAGKVVAGGPAVKLYGAPWADETPAECPFDVLAMHNPLATFTTRGCPNRCAFCAVPRIEGEFRELPTWKPAPIVCDNNLTAASRGHWERVIESLRPFPLVDFNQGFEARRFTIWQADLLAKLRMAKIRFALDSSREEGAVYGALQTCRKAGLRDFGVYVLIGFNDTPDDALHRLELVRSWKIRPTPMRYQPLDTLVKNGYVAPGWPAYELRRMMQYWSRLRVYEHIPYADFHRSADPDDLPLFNAKERIPC